MDQPVTKTPAQLVEEYIWLRDERDRARNTLKEHMKAHFDDPLDKMEAQLLDMLNKAGLDSFSSDKGTAYKSLSTSVTVADSREFRRHVIGSEEWDLVDWRVSKTAVNERVERGEALPPGVNRSAFFQVGIRRKS